MFLMFLLLGVLLAFSVSYLTGRSDPFGEFDVPSAHRGLEVIDVARVCDETVGLVKAMIKESPTRARWDCINYTGYTDSYGRRVGGNCDGPISYRGRVECECMGVTDTVTGRLRPTAQLNVSGVELCTSNPEMFEVD